MRSDNENQVDKSAPYTGNRKYSDGGYNGSTSKDCAADLDHNRWYRLAQNLAAGTYRLQVTTSSTGNSGTNAENIFGIQVTSSGSAKPRIHGLGRMAAFANVNGRRVAFLPGPDRLGARRQDDGDPVVRSGRCGR